MRTYQVEITETLKMKVNIEANSPAEAEEIAKQNWQNSEYILDADNFVGAEFNTVAERKPRQYER
jgi:hypothetical protein